jgi:hypothetical protein
VDECKPLPASTLVASANMRDRPAVVLTVAGSMENMAPEKRK